LTGAGVPDAPTAPGIHFKSPTVAVICWQEPVSNGATVSEYHLEWTFREDQDFMPVSTYTYVSFIESNSQRLNNNSRKQKQKQRQKNNRVYTVERKTQL